MAHCDCKYLSMHAHACILAFLQSNSQVAITYLKDF